MGGEPARHAKEPRLRLAVGSLTMPTLATGLTRVRWVDQRHAHTSSLRLVGDERAQLKERPTVQHSPLALGTVDSATDVRQVLQRNAAPCALNGNALACQPQTFLMQPRIQESSIVTIS